MKKQGLASRLIVAAWGIPLILVLTWLGGWWTVVLVAAISLMALYEFYNLMEKIERKPLKWFGLFFGLLICLMWIVDLRYFPWIMITAFLLIATIALLRERSFADIIATIGGIAYIPLLAGSFIFIRDYMDVVNISEFGRGLALCIWGALWVGDTAAYAGGRIFGKHKLAEKVSPNKTVEGFIFGFIGAILFCLIWWKIGFVDFNSALMTGFTAGLFGQIGDLVESKIKRECSVKDTSNLFPGHGGALDRFDSLLFTAPLVAMYLMLRYYLAV